MTSRDRDRLLIWGALVAAILIAAGIALALWLGGDEEAHVVPMPTTTSTTLTPPPKPKPLRSFQSVASPEVGDKLLSDNRIVHTAQAVAQIDAAKAALRQTTISGKKYCLAMAGCAGTGYSYRGGFWYQGLGSMVFARAISPATTYYDTAGNALIATTISGVTYFANPAKYAGQKWDQAMKALAAERAVLVANPADLGPQITVQPAP